MSDWEVEPREVPVELEDTYPHATFPPEPTRFADWTTQLEGADFAALKSWAHGGIGQPDSNTSSN